MRYLIDTNIISEVVRHRPNERVIEWLKNTPDESLYISVLTIAGRIFYILPEHFGGVV